jgi:hypothetical protein
MNLIRGNRSSAGTAKTMNFEFNFRAEAGFDLREAGGGGSTIM